MTLGPSFSQNKGKSQADQFTAVEQHTSVLTEKSVIRKNLQDLKISRISSNYCIYLHMQKQPACLIVLPYKIIGFENILWLRQEI